MSGQKDQDGDPLEGLGPGRGLWGCRRDVGPGAPAKGEEREAMLTLSGSGSWTKPRIPDLSVWDPNVS